MSSIKKLKRSKLIIEKELSIYLKNLYFEPKLARIHIILRDETKLFIQYNNHNEYAYSILFSKIELDRVRFDNYDDRWNVSTKPHHFHPRYNKVGFYSLMNGNPEHDISLFCKYVKSGELLNPELQFNT